MNGYEVLNSYRQASAAPRHATPNADGFAFDDGLSELIDETPRTVALIGFGAIATLIALKVFGFRFAFGVNVGK